MRVSLVSVPVIDPIAAFMFYTQKIGVIEKTFMPEMKLAIVVSPEDKDGTAVLLEPRGNLNSDVYWEGIYNAGLPVIILGSEDVQTDFERLKNKGVVFKQAPTKNEWGTQAIFDDTCGNFIQIHQP